MKSLTLGWLETGYRHREMWTLALHTALKQRSPIVAHGLAHTYHTHSFLWHKSQTIVAKSAACNKRWKELEKWKWWLNAAVQSGSAAWMKAHSDGLHGIPFPALTTCLRGARECKQTSTELCPNINKHSYSVTASPPSAPILSGSLYLRYLCATWPLLVAISLQVAHANQCLSQKKDGSRILNLTKEAAAELRTEYFPHSHFFESSNFKCKSGIHLRPHPHIWAWDPSRRGRDALQHSRGNRSSEWMLAKSELHKQPKLFHEAAAGGWADTRLLCSSKDNRICFFCCFFCHLLVFIVEHKPNNVKM